MIHKISERYTRILSNVGILFSDHQGNFVLACHKIYEECAGTIKMKSFDLLFLTLNHLFYIHDLYTIMEEIYDLLKVEYIWILFLLFPFILEYEQAI